MPPNDPIPAFDPNKPFTVGVGAPPAQTGAPPPFDPNKPFTTGVGSDQTPADVSQQGFFRRMLAGFNKVPRDTVDEFMSGVYATARAPAEILGYGKPAWPISYLGAPKDYEQTLMAGGIKPDDAKTMASHLNTEATQLQGLVDLYTGPIQAIASPILGSIRSFFTRPIEEAYGVPQQYTEAAMAAAGFLLGYRGKFSKTTIGSEGEWRTDHFEQPTNGDFTNATRQLTHNNIIDGEYEVVNDNLRLAWEKEGLHPSEAVKAASNDPLLRQQLAVPSPNPIDRSGIEPPKGSALVVPQSRVQQALTGDPYIDSVLKSSVTSNTINNPKVNDSFAVPYTAGGSIPLEDNEFLIDYRFPKSFTVSGVTFNPAHFFVTHENIEQHLIDVFTKGGMPLNEAYIVAHDMAEKAEGAMYRAHGIDQAAAEAAYAPYMERIQNDAPGRPFPPNLYERPYPHDNPSAARTEPFEEDLPTPEMIARAHVILADAGFGPPPLSTGLSASGIARSNYPQFRAGSSPPGGHGLPPGQPPPPPLPPPPAGQAPPYQGPAPMGQPTRPPYFTYDDRGPFRKAFDGAIRGWQNTFQPELVSDAALQADPRFAEYKAATQNKRDQILVHQEESRQYWRTQTDAQRLQYLSNLESGRTQPIGWRQSDAIHRQILDQAYQMEKQYGSKADFYDNYFPHIFESPQQARQWIEGQTAQRGATWFQKARTFQTIKDAMDAGLRLKTTNPEELVTMRLNSSAEMLERSKLISDMSNMGLAIKVSDARAQRAAKIAAAQRLGLPIDITTVGRDLADEGWQVVNGPDREQHFISPDIQPLWQNAVEAKGLWMNEGPLGSTFRGWMALKTAWMPIKLGLSAFHPIHVLGINLATDVVRAIKQAARGEYGDALKSYGDVIYDPIAAAFPKLELEGRVGREAWLKPEGMRSPLESAIVKAMEESGFVPQVSEELRIDSQKKLEDAWDRQDWFRALPQFIREGIRRLSAPVFEHWIPNLKTTAFLRQYSDFMKAHPQIANDDIQRAVAGRTIAKSVENRYGQMFYGGLFWNRTLKDAGIGSLISLGWQLGMVREFGGAAITPIARAVRGISRAPTQTEETIFQAQSKQAYTLAYITSSLMIAGIITYLATGEDPEGMDWFMPRIGGTNPDGSPRRVSTPFYTREVPMAAKRIESQGAVAGVADLLTSKMVTSPLTDILRNRDYYGNEIWSENAPLYKQGWQAIHNQFGQQLNPISITGVRQQLKTGGGWDEAALAMLGFGPAPSYANRTPTQNRISYLFGRYVPPATRPEELGEQSLTRADIRNEILMAQKRGDQAALTDASRRFLDSGGSPTGLSNVINHYPADVSMFRALPEVAQQNVMDHATPEEQLKYRPFLKSDTAARVAKLQVDMMQTQDPRERLDIAKQLQTLIEDGVHNGQISNMREFQRSVAQQLMFRIMPGQAAQIQALRRRQFMPAPTPAPIPGPAPTPPMALPPRRSDQFEPSGMLGIRG